MSREELMMDEEFVRRDRMRFIKNSQSSNLCYLGILFDVLYFVSIFKSDVGTYYYRYIIGVSIVYNLVFLLAAFLASEGVKNYKKNYSYLLIVLGVIQFIRIMIIPMDAHSAMTLVNGVEAQVMHDGQFFKVIIYLVVSGLALLAAGVINMKKCKDLDEHNKALEGMAA